MIVADTSGLLAWFNRAEPAHLSVAGVMEGDDVLVVSPFVLAELDYLLATRVGVEAELAALAELAAGAYLLAGFAESDLDSAARVIDTYRDQAIGLADASIVVLAARFGTKRLLTLDRRHFAVLRPLDGGRFDILPPAGSGFG